MGNNAEIRQRMDTYRSILLVINWIGSIIEIIVGLVLIGVIGGYAAIIIIIAIVLGIVGHFLINVALAIPFILLNNGDILESMKRNAIGNASSVTSSVDMKNCPFCAENIKDKAKICPHCNRNIEEYENELKNKEEENKRKREQEQKEKIAVFLNGKGVNNILDLFDEKTIEDAKNLRRIHGKSMYISHLKNKAKELGLGDIDINENDID